MKVSEIIANVDRIRPNQYEKDLKTMWLNEIEGIVVDDVLNMSEGNNIELNPYNYEADGEKELLVPDRFCDLYLNYIIAKIDYHDGETDSYINDVAMYESAFDSFAAWHIRNNIPKQQGVIRGW